MGLLWQRLSIYAIIYPEVIIMATMNVSLPDPMKEWVEDQVGGGLYSNASDYVRDLIRQDQDAQNKRELLVKALKKGEKSGVSKRTLDDIWNDVKASKR
jgi:antitoxin ParD1/3/4